jgi:two-component system OmpR family response regulator
LTSTWSTGTTIALHPTEKRHGANSQASEAQCSQKGRRWTVVGTVTPKTAQERALRILVVDDNQDAANSLHVILRMWGYDCRVAYDGPSGLDEARVYLPDCMVLDINMPKMDGFSVARQVRQQPELERSKLIALTAYSDMHHAERIRKAGFDYHLIKPADLTELQRILEMLNEIMRLATRTEDLARQNILLAGQTQELLKEVKEDISEVKEEVKEIKKELREAKESRTDEPPGRKSDQ